MHSGHNYVYYHACKLNFELYLDNKAASDVCNKISSAQKQ